MVQAHSRARCTKRHKFLESKRFLLKPDLISTGHLRTSPTDKHLRTSVEMKIGVLAGR